jgi:hypothetical protein
MDRETEELLRGRLEYEATRAAGARMFWRGIALLLLPFFVIAALVVAIVVGAIIVSAVDGNAASPYPDCRVYLKHPPAALKGAKVIAHRFIVPSGATFALVHLGTRVLCEQDDDGPITAKDRAQALRQIKTGKYVRPKLSDFSVAYDSSSCDDLYYDCYDPSSPNFSNAAVCAEFTAKCTGGGRRSDLVNPFTQQRR